MRCTPGVRWTFLILILFRNGNYHVGAWRAPLLNYWRLEIEFELLFPPEGDDMVDSEADADALANGVVMVAWHQRQCLRPAW